MGTYPKFYKTYGQLQSGKLGPMKVSNGLIEVQNEEQQVILEGLQSFKDGGIMPVGLKQSVEILPNGGFKKIVIPNRFDNVFTEEEMTNINLIPDDVFEETVLFNIRQIAKDYSEAGAVQSPDKSGFSEERSTGEGQDEIPVQERPGMTDESKKPEPLPMSAFKSKDAIKTVLEELGVMYPSNAKMAELYEIYTQNFVK